MNKKVVIAFGISVFLGLAYLGYRNSALGRRLKRQFIIGWVLKRQQKKRSKWDFPEAFIEEVRAELMLLDFSELELVEAYIKMSLLGGDEKQLEAIKEKLQEEGVYKKTELKAVEHFIYNASGLSNRFIP